MTYSRNLLTLWILLSVVVGLSQDYFQLVAAYEEQAASLMVYEGPIWIKALKDFCILGLLLMCVTSKAEPLGPALLAAEISTLLLVTVLFTVSVDSNGWAVAFAGIRWFLPILLLFWMRRLAEQPDPVVVSGFLVACLAANVVFQVVQLENFPPIYGLRESGLAARVPGFFLVPNTTAFFAAVGAAFAVTHFRSLPARVGVLALAMVSIMLAQSGTGVLCLIALAAFLVARRHVAIFLLMAIPALVLVLGVLDALVGRVEYLEISGGDRLAKLRYVLDVGALSIDNFGIFTNTGVLLQARYSDAGVGTIITDSFYVSILGNFGVLTIPFLILTYAYVRGSLAGLEIRNMLPALIVYGGFSFSTIITEAFPMSVLLAVLLWSGRDLERKPEMRVDLSVSNANLRQAGA